MNIEKNDSVSSGSSCLDDRYGNDVIELSIVMPCLNESETLAMCIDKAKQFMRENDVRGEIIVADNGSTDGSKEIALTKGAKLVIVEQKGYGSALLAGINSAAGAYVIMGDSDDSYDFLSLEYFLEKLRAGYDLVMGNRFKGGIQKGAMPFLNRYLGNPVLSGIGNIFFPSPCSDFHCGLRGFRKRAIDQLDLQTTGMEFASEMLVKAVIHKLKITEVPTILSPDGRSRPPHLKRWQDGWRHLRFLLLYSPSWLFLYPGFLLLLVGCLTSFLLLSGSKGIFSIHTLVFANASVIIGYQAIAFAVFSKFFAVKSNLLPRSRLVKVVERLVNLEKGIFVGLGFLSCGFAMAVAAFLQWSKTGFSELNPSNYMRIVLPASTLMILGCQIIQSSFFLSFLSLKKR